MSSGGYRKVTVGRHWSRPKPKIYDCNYRDHERAYQDSYKDYSTTKQYLRENASDWAEKDAAIRNELDNIQKYGVRRAGSATSRRYQTSTPVESPIALRRANSTLAAQEANAEGSYLKSRLEASKERSYLAERAERAAKAKEEESSFTSISTRATSLPKKVQTSYEVSQDEEMANIERRLQKLRKLREELGLPSEVGSNTTSTESKSARGKEIKSSSVRSSSITRNADSTDDYSSSKRSARSSAISSSTSNSTQMTNGRSSLSKEISEDIKPSRKSARAAAAAAAASSTSSSSSKMTNGRSSLSREDIETKYSSAEPSPRLSKRRADEFQSKKTSVKSSSTKVSSSKIIDDVENYDDDMLLPDIRKKLPTSQEILDKIKDMDL